MKLLVTKKKIIGNKMMKVVGLSEIIMRATLKGKHKGQIFMQNVICTFNEYLIVKITSKK